MMEKGGCPQEQIEEQVQPTIEEGVSGVSKTIREVINAFIATKKMLLNMMFNTTMKC